MNTLIFSMDDPHGPGYRLVGRMLPGCIGITLELYSVFPGARDPRPHRLLQITLPPEAFGRLVDLIKAGTTCLP